MSEKLSSIVSVTEIKFYILLIALTMSRSVDPAGQRQQLLAGGAQHDDDDLTLGTGIVTTRIDIEGLSRDLNAFKDRLDVWAESVVDGTEKEKLQFVQNMAKLAGAYRWSILDKDIVVS